MSSKHSTGRDLSRSSRNSSERVRSRSRGRNKRVTSSHTKRNSPLRVISSSGRRNNRNGGRHNNKSPGAHNRRSTPIPPTRSTSSGREKASPLARQTTSSSLRTNGGSSSHSNEIDRLKQALAAAEEKSVLKQLTIKQKDDLIIKNRKLMEDMAELKEKNESLYDRIDDLEQRYENLKDSCEDTEEELKSLKRRLGSKDYQYLMETNIYDLTSSMGKPACEAFESIKNLNLCDKDTIRITLALLESITPEARFTLIKTLVALESTSFRSTVFVAISKLVEADKLRHTFVKEVLDSNAAKEVPVTPKHCGNASSTPVTIVEEDPSSINKEVAKYFTDKNNGCKVVKVKGVNVLAFSKDSSMTTLHKMFTDAHGKEVKKKCFACAAVLTPGVSKIAPMIIVGPENHGRLGDKAWVCFEHWNKSTSMEVDEDILCDAAALEAESDLIESSLSSLLVSVLEGMPKRSFLLMSKHIYWKIYISQSYSIITFSFQGELGM